MLNPEILRRCAESWPDRPEIDPAETLYTPEQLEAQIDVAIQNIGLLLDAGAWMMKVGAETVRGICDLAEQLKPTKNQTLPAFRRPSWQRRV